MRKSTLRRWAPALMLALLAAASPFLLFAGPRRSPALLVIPVLWIARRVVLHNRPRRTPLDLALLLLLIMVLVSLWAVPDPAWSLPKLGLTLLGVGLFAVTVDLLRGMDWQRWVSPSVLLGSLGLLGLGLVGTRWIFKISLLAALLDRLPGVMPLLPAAEASFHPNVVGGALLWFIFPNLLLFLWGLGQDRRASVWTAAHGLALVLTAGMLFLTQSRAAWLAAAAVLWGLLALAGGRWGRALAVVMLVAAGVTVAVGLPQLGSALFPVSETEVVFSTANWQGRLEMWSRAQYGIEDFCFTGMGLDGFRHIMPVLYPLFSAGPDAFIPHAHNEFLQTALDLGLPGLVAWLALYGGTFWLLGVAYRSAASRWTRYLALGLGAALAAHALHGAADSGVLDAKPHLVFWVVLGLAVALYEERGRAGEGESGRGGEGVREHGRIWLAVGAVLLALTGAGGYLGWRALQRDGALPGSPAIRLPIYPGAQGTDVRSEAPAADAGWSGPLEVATFTTTHPITSVVSFYTTALAEGGWQENIAAGDPGSWGGIYTQNGGRAVCLLNLFDIDGQVWGSIVCGDKVEPVDLPSLSPLPTPTVEP